MATLETLPADTSVVRVTAALALSPNGAELVAHPRIIEVAAKVPGPHCENYRIGSTTAIEIHPGEGHQALHQDGY